VDSGRVHKSLTGDKLKQTNEMNSSAEKAENALEVGRSEIKSQITPKMREVMRQNSEALRQIAAELSTLD
jgi:hypothetical protein